MMLIIIVVVIALTIRKSTVDAFAIRAVAVAKSERGAAGCARS